MVVGDHVEQGDHARMAEPCDGSDLMEHGCLGGTTLRPSQPARKHDLSDNDLPPKQPVFGVPDRPELT
jgi:hypothetical protein